MKKIFLALIFAAVCGVYGFGQTPTPTPSAGNGIGTGSGSGIGAGNGGNNGIGTSGPPPPRPANGSGEITALRILSKPRAVYTPEARENEVQGTVTLRVAFLASGVIGSVSSVSGLPSGLTEQAIAAAKQIEFEPATRGGVPYSVTKTIRYDFVHYGTYYLDENDKLLEKKAEILEMPVPELSPDEIKNSGGKMKVSVLLDPRDGASLFKPNAAWSRELTQKIREAVVKIKFNPALKKSEGAVTQLKEIEYVFPE